MTGDRYICEDCDEGFETVAEGNQHEVDTKRAHRFNVGHHVVWDPNLAEWRGKHTRNAEVIDFVTRRTIQEARRGE